jgi:hypothetical protein
MPNISTADVMLAGVSVAGPKGSDETVRQWRDRCRRAALQVALMTSDGSPEFKAIDRVREAKILTGTVLTVEQETSSTRAKITFQASVGKNQDTPEELRTDRGDTAIGAEMIRRVRALVGHRVRLWKFNEPDQSGKVSQGFRIVVHIEDLGEAK